MILVDSLTWGGINIRRDNVEYQMYLLLILYFWTNSTALKRKKVSNTSIVGVNCALMNTNSGLMASTKSIQVSESYILPAGTKNMIIVFLWCTHKSLVNERIKFERYLYCGLLQPCQGKNRPSFNHITQHWYNTITLMHRLMAYVFLSTTWLVVFVGKEHCLHSQLNSSALLLHAKSTAYLLLNVPRHNVIKIAIKSSQSVD